MIKVQQASNSNVTLGDPSPDLPKRARKVGQARPKDVILRRFDLRFEEVTLL